MNQLLFPKISVIVPVYNMASSLSRTIDSLLNQIYEDYEILLVDDGSTDGSGDICESYASVNPKIRVYHKPNGGLSSARNFGMEKAIGEWVTFCDADDWVYPEWLENFNLDHSEGFDLICQGIECDKPIYEGDTNQYPYKYSLNFEGDSIEALNELYSHLILGYTVIKAYRRNIIKENELCFDTSLKLQEDEVFLFQYLKYSKTVRIYDKIGYYYYVPDWSKKYKLTFGEREHFLLKSIEYTCDLDNNSLTVIKSRRLELSQLYYDEFFSTTQNRKYCISQLRKLLKDSFKESQIFYPIRLIILFDKSGIFAKTILTMHLNIKKRLHKLMG